MHSIDLKKKEVARQIRAELCRLDFYYFVQELWSEIVHETPVWNWHIKYLCDELQQIGQGVANREKSLYDYYIINIPPGSSKTTIVSIMYPIWCWTIDPSQRFICSSHSDTVSLDIAERSRRLFRCEKYQYLFPEVNPDPDTSAKSHFKNTYGGERYATSSGSNIAGVHAHQILADDPIDPRGANSEAERVQANKHITETLSTRKVDKDLTVTILVMQRLHEMDPSGLLLSMKGIRVKHICLPAELRDNVFPPELKTNYVDGLLDPIRLSHSAIKTLRAILGTMGSAGQLDQTPAPEDGAIIKKSWFGEYDMLELIQKARDKGVELIWNCDMDGAFTKKKENAQSALLSWCEFDNNMYIKESFAVWEETPEFKNSLVEFAYRNGCNSRSAAIRFEPEANALPVAQMLQRETKLNIIIDKAPTVDKLARVRGVAPFLESGRCRLLRNGPGIAELVHQCVVFPNGRLKDRVDTLTQAIKNFQGGGKDSINAWGIAG